MRNPREGMLVARRKDLDRTFLGFRCNRAKSWVEPSLPDNLLFFIMLQFLQ